MRSKRIAKFVAIGICAVIVFAALPEAVVLLWNALMPVIFGLHSIGYWQAMGLMVLSWLLLGRSSGFRGGPGGARHWRHRVAERIEKMPPEEREKFLQELRGRCGQGQA